MKHRFLLRRVAVFFMASFVVLSLCAQNTFSNLYSINPEFGDYAKSFVVLDDGGISFHASTLVTFPEEYGQDQMARIDGNGDLVWSEQLNLATGVPLIVSWSEGAALVNDTIYSTFTTSDGSKNHGYVKSSVLNGGSITCVEESDSIHFIPKFLLFNKDSTSLTRINTHLLPGSPGQHPMYVDRISTDGEVLWSSDYLTDYRTVVLDAAILDEDDNLYVSFRGCKSQGNCNGKQGGLIKIDQYGSVLWVKRYSRTYAAFAPPTGVAMLPGNRLMYSFVRDTNTFNVWDNPPIVYLLDEDGLKLDSNTFHGTIRVLNDLKATGQGDVIGTGFTRIQNKDFGWVVRIDADLNMVWERFILDERIAEAGSELLQIAETDDGTITAVGAWFANDPPADGGRWLRSWVVKLDANGCLNVPCTSDTIWLKKPVSLGEVDGLDPEQIEVFPNPIQDVLNVVISGHLAGSGRIAYSIVSVTGAKLRTGLINGEAQFNLSGYPRGIYFLRLYQQGQIILARKIVKQ